MTNDAPRRPILDEIDRTLSDYKDAAYAAKKTYDQSAVGRLQKDLTVWGRFWGQIVASLLWIHQKIGRPLAGRGLRAARWTVRRYRELWNRVVYVKDEYGEPRFSRTRGGVMVLSTGAFVTIALVPMLWFLVLTPWYFLTVRQDEVLYLTNSQELVDSKGATHDVHTIGGCEELPCSDRNSVSLRVRADLFNHVWSLVHHGGFFYPDFVAKAVPNVVSKCVVSTYGMRWKFVVRNWDWYPDLLEVKACHPLTYEKLPEPGAGK